MVTAIKVLVGGAASRDSDGEKVRLKSFQTTSTSTPKKQQVSRPRHRKSSTARLKKSPNTVIGKNSDGSRPNERYGQRGVTMRPSGKWQVQYFYCGKSRYIGVFESKIIAFAAYESAREILGKVETFDIADEEIITARVDAARKFVTEAAKSKANCQSVSRED